MDTLVDIVPCLFTGVVARTDIWRHLGWGQWLYLRYILDGPVLRWWFRRTQSLDWGANHIVFLVLKDEWKGEICRRIYSSAFIYTEHFPTRQGM